jgi:hypothetical protein
VWLLQGLDLTGESGGLQASTGRDVPMARGDALLLPAWGRTIAIVGIVSTVAIHPVIRS